MWMCKLQRSKAFLPHFYRVCTCFCGAFGEFEGVYGCVELLPDDGHGGGVVFVLIDSHDKHRGVGWRSGDHHTLSPTLDMSLGGNRTLLIHFCTNSQSITTCHFLLLPIILLSRYYMTNCSVVLVFMFIRIQFRRPFHCTFYCTY